MNQHVVWTVTEIDRLNARIRELERQLEQARDSAALYMQTIERLVGCSDRWIEDEMKEDGVYIMRGPK